MDVPTQRHRQQWFNQLPMLVTYSRIALSPLLFLFPNTNEDWKGWFLACVFAIASATDWLDGYLARRLQAESNLGKLMDPVADKILVLCGLLVLLSDQQISSALVALLLCRDVYIGGLRTVAASNNVIIAALPFGKWKTALQMIAIPCLFIKSFLDFPLSQIGLVILWLSVVLSYISAIQYGWRYFRPTTPPK